MDFKIKEIYLDNFKSFKDCRIKLDDFNVVIAPNNAGKSNLITALEFINSIFKYGLEKTLNEFGGLETIKNYRSDKDENITIGIKVFASHFIYGFIGNYVNVFDNKENTKTIYLDFEFRNTTIEFKIKFNEKNSQSFLNAYGKYKNKSKHKNFRKFNFSYLLEEKKIISTDLPKKYENYFLRIFINLANKQPDLKVLGNIYSYYFISKEIKKISNYKSGRELNKEGTNLASVLDYLKENYPDVFENISTSLIGIVDELEGVEIKSDSLGRAKLEFVERINLERKQFIPVDIVSDGTINLIATLTALYEPYEKSLIAIEEPERHLHLRAISYLMEEFRNISEKKPILITTQSTEILHNLDLKKDNLIFLFRDYEGNTKAITHRDIARFKQKLKAYNNDIVKLIKLEGLGYLGDYIGEEG